MNDQLKALVTQMREAVTSWEEGTEGVDRTELAEAVSFFVTTWNAIEGAHDWPWEYTDWPWDAKEEK